MQRMPVELESRHRLLHLRASLERKWSQPRLKNKETIMLPIIWERDASRGILKGFTIASWKILNFVDLNSNMKKSVSRWTRTRRKISRMTQEEYFRYRKNWWISLNKSGKIGPVRDRSDFNDALTTLNRLHQESGEQQLRPVPFWKYQQWHQSSSSSSSCRATW